jgi:membrane-associated phospholipid phosphatase
MPLSREDRWLTGCLLVMLALSFLMMGVNAASFRYTSISYFPRLFTPLICLALQFSYFDRCYLFISPRAGFIVKSCALYGLIMIASAALVTGLQTTPFPPIDAALLRWDRALGFDTAAALRWTAARPALRAFLNACYDSTDVQLVFAPLIAGFAFDRRRLRVYLYAIVYAFLAGGLVYYFFPSSGPATVVPSPDFLWVQRATSLKFYQVHHFQPVATMLGGMIAFPSFHVAWSVLLSYAALPWRKAFPFAAVWNALVVVSTVLLGWHYLVDVPAGLLLGFFGIVAGEFTYSRLSS